VSGARAELLHNIHAVAKTHIQTVFLAKTLLQKSVERKRETEQRNTSQGFDIITTLRLNILAKYVQMLRVRDSELYDSASQLRHFAAKPTDFWGKKIFWPKTNRFFGPKKCFAAKVGLFCGK
jgi:hypothetical protein